MGSDIPESKISSWVGGLLLAALVLLPVAYTAPQQPGVTALVADQPPPVRARAAKPVVGGGDVPVVPADPRHREEYVPNQVLVRFRRDTPKAWMNIAHGVARAKVLKDFPPIEGLYLVQIPADETVEDAIKAYQNQPEVLYAQPNFIYYPSVIPNDPCFTGNVSGTCPAGNRDMWGLHNLGGFGGTTDADIDAPEAWDITTGSASVAVVVIDTGIDYNHPDLMANIAQLESNCSDMVDNDGNGRVDDCKGFDFLNNDNDPFDDINHGTHVAGTIGAVGNNSTGVVGVNHTVKLIACKFLGPSGGSTGDAIDCLNYVIATKNAHPELKFIGSNNSWGGRGFDPALDDAIQVQRQNGLLFIAAAGNENADNDWILSAPSNSTHPNVIAVAATTRNDGIASFSNYGQQTVHIGAPGQTVLSTTPANTYSFFSGTSMATPHTTGVAALLKAQDPNRDWKKIKNLIISSGDPISALAGKTVSGRRLNARNAMTCSNQTVDGRVLPVLDVVYGQVGVPITLSMYHINCADPAAGNPQVTVSGGSPISLLDDGLGVDEEANDGVFSGTFTPASATNTTLTFPGGDVVTVFFPINPTANYNAPTTTTFNYRNLSGAAKNLSFGDDTRAVVESPFPIAFGGGSFRLLNIGNNGHITFDTAFSGLAFSNSSLPTASPATIVAPWWDDLFSFPDDVGPIGQPQNVFYDVQGTAPNRELVLEWHNVEQFSCPAGQTITFETVFFENSSNVLFNYLDTTFDPTNSCTSSGLNPNNGGAATVGVQVSASQAQQFSFNTASLSANLALLFVGPSGGGGSNPVPSLSSLNPSTTNGGGPQFTLTVNGSNFVNGAVVRWNGSDRSTSFVNANQLTATIPAADIAAPGTASVTVFNPAPGGGTSNALTFAIATVSDPRPPAAFQTIVPHSAFGGGFLTRLFVTNLTNNNNAVTINRINQGGVVVQTTNVTLAPGGTLLLADAESQRTQPLTIQWFAIGSQLPIAASDLFDFDSQSLGLPQNFRTAVGVLSAESLSALTFPVRVVPDVVGGNTAKVTVGAALANLSASTSTVNLKLLDKDGNILAQDSISLGPFAQFAFSLQDRPAFKNIILGVPEFVGAVAVTTANSNQPVAAIVVGNNLDQLFSLPVSSGVAK